MQETKSLTSVAEFHKTFQHTIFPEPEVPNSKKRELRVSLFAEELKELVVGIQNGDKVEIADALFDIRYVLAGTVLEFGLADQFKSLFDEVQHSNLSQASETEEEVQPTLTPYQSQGEEYFYEQVNTLYMVYRLGERKTLKSIYYYPADQINILST